MPAYAIRALSWNPKRFGRETVELFVSLTSATLVARCSSLVTRSLAALKEIPCTQGNAYDIGADERGAASIGYRIRGRVIRTRGINAVVSGLSFDR
jgi:hypothetical protein